VSPLHKLAEKNFLVHMRHGGRKGQRWKKRIEKRKGAEGGENVSLSKSPKIGALTGGGVGHGLLRHYQLQPWEKEDRRKVK